jgi:hypothetical protein
MNMIGVELIFQLVDWSVTLALHKRTPLSNPLCNSMIISPVASRSASRENKYKVQLRFGHRIEIAMDIEKRDKKTIVI